MLQLISLIYLLLCHSNDLLCLVVQNILDQKPDTYHGMTRHNMKLFVILSYVVVISIGVDLLKD